MCLKRKNKVWIKSIDLMKTSYSKLSSSLREPKVETFSA